MSENLLELLLRELRAAVAARVPDGTGPDEMTAELRRRLGQVRKMQADEARRHPRNPRRRGRGQRPEEPSTPDPGRAPTR